MADFSVTGAPIDGIMSDWPGAGTVWGSSASGSIGGKYGQARVRAQHDKIKADHINQLREQIEFLIGHTHPYVDEAATTTKKKSFVSSIF